MSRSKRGSSRGTTEYWGRRKLSPLAGDRQGTSKQMGIQRERAYLKDTLTKLILDGADDEYDEREYDPYCAACANGTCPLYDEEGNQVGANGDFDWF